MKIIVTGGAGFIGSNFLHFMVPKYPQYEFVNLDSLTYAGNLENLSDLEHMHNYRLERVDITDVDSVNRVFADGVDVVANFAAESHVDRSILNPNVFVQTNVVGTQVLLDAAVRYGVKKFVQISTDEVYGTLGDSGRFTEESPLLPNSPYSASKASADLLVRSYHHTFGLPMNITRCSNNYGSYQFPEKLIPLMISRALAGESLPVYGDGMNVRDWMHVEDHCAAIDLVIHHGQVGEVYNIGGYGEETNINVVKAILRELDRSEDLIHFVEDRPGHDRRYAIDPGKIERELGWKPSRTFSEGIRQTVRWYIEHREWWQNILSGSYREYYERQYGRRLHGES